eukprot:4365420-Alexandrium_andersonii.AAC.1
MSSSRAVRNSSKMVVVVLAWSSMAFSDTCSSAKPPAQHGAWNSVGRVTRLLYPATITAYMPRVRTPWPHCTLACNTRTPHATARTAPDLNTRARSMGARRDVRRE